MIAANPADAKLSARERKFFNAVTTDVGYKEEKLLPQETIDRIFENLTTAHPLSTDLLKDKYNRFIPLIVSVVGVLLACWIDGSIRPETIVYGALSGLASTGMHQAFTRLIGGNE